MKIVLAVIVGTVVTFVVIAAMQYAGHMLIPVEGMDPVPDLSSLDGMTEFNDRFMAMTEAERAAFAEAQPLMAKLWIPLSYFVGTFLGALLAAKLAKSMRAAVSVGVVMTVVGLFDAFVTPSPLWVAALAVVVYLPAALLGGKVSGVAKAS